LAAPTFRHKAAEDAFVHHGLGFSFAELGQLDDALRAWLRVLELDPGYDFSRFGHVLAARGN
jgi:lipoprotein NlpI